MQIAGVEVIGRTEINALLGGVSDSSVARFVKAHQLQSMRVGGKVYYAREAVEAAARAALGLKTKTAEADK